MLASQRANISRRTPEAGTSSVKRELISARSVRYFTRNAKLVEPGEPNNCLATFRNYLAVTKIKGPSARPRNSRISTRAYQWRMARCIVFIITSASQLHSLTYTNISERLEFCVIIDYLVRYSRVMPSGLLMKIFILMHAIKN